MVYLSIFGCIWVYLGIFGCIWVYLGKKSRRSDFVVVCITCLYLNCISDFMLMVILVSEWLSDWVLTTCLINGAADMCLLGKVDGMGTRQLGSRTTRAETSRPVSEN
jgi:hypothetical protein